MRVTVRVRMRVSETQYVQTPTQNSDKHKRAATAFQAALT